LRDTPLTVNGRAFDVLVALVRRGGALASKQALLDEVWPGVAVEENNVTTQVLNLRKLFATHDPATPYIVTDAGRGYRFVAEVSVPQTATPPVAEPETTAESELPASVPEPQAARERHNLPPELNSFIGRTAELAEIAQRLATTSLLTLVGSGGVGKTRCAVRAGHTELPHYTDGVWLVELAPMHESALVAEALCRVIGAPVSGDRPAAEVAAAFLRQRNLLLILDNCEHVLEAAARLAATLLKQCPGIKIIATSRQPLGIDGETVLRMPSLPLPSPNGHMTAAAALQSDAVRLFVDRADAASGGYVLTDEDAPSVMAICRRLDGVAMATELAAARLRMLKPAEIAARLEDVFRLLTGGSKTALPRQQTLRATIDWSFALLSLPEQILLRRLSVFVDGFSLEGATAVAAGDPIDEQDVLDLLQALVDKSLVNADTTGATTRYRMLETTSHYAREKLVENSELDRFGTLAKFLAGFYARAEVSWSTTATVPWLDEFGPEVENLRAAIDWSFGHRRNSLVPSGAVGNPDLGIALVSSAGCIAEEMSLLTDMKRWTTIAIKHLSPSTPKATAGWILYWATRHQSVFGVRELSELRKRAIALFREANDIVGLSCCLRTAGIALARPGEQSGEALAMLTEAVSLLRPLGRTKDLATALAHLGGFYYINSDEASAQSLSEEALMMRRELGDQTGELVSYLNLAEFAFVQGNIELAIRYAEKALPVARARRVQEVIAAVLSNLANYFLASNKLQPARAAATEALEIYQALGTEDYAIVCIEHLALSAALEGDPERAARLFGYSDAHFRRSEQVRDRPEAIRTERLVAELRTRLATDRLISLTGEGAEWPISCATRTAVQRSDPAGSVAN
jgi:predicted ATPase/DNA-binding winged helix-turn-helix (wHTH) protein